MVNVMPYDEKRMRRALVASGVGETTLDTYIEHAGSVDDYYRDNDLALDVFNRRYRGPEEHGPLHMWDRVARAMASVEPIEKQEQVYTDFLNLLSDFKFVPGGRIMHGAGRVDARRQPTLSNCYVIPIEEDSLEGIYYCIFESAMVYRSGGGVGTDLSILRPKGTPVNATFGSSPGSTSFMNLLSESTNTVSQAGRRGALMLTLRVDHPDIEDFIVIKNDPLRQKVQYANISVLITDEFMDAVESDRGFDLRWGGKVYRTVRARDLWDRIIKNAHASAEPGIIFWDTMRAYHNVEYANPLVSTNPCVVGSTLVPTSRGLERMDSLVGKEVEIITAVDFSINGLAQRKVVKRRIGGSFGTGKKFTYKLITKSGYELIVTEDHKILTLDGWKPLKELKLGEKILLQEGKSFFNQDRSLPFGTGKWSRELGIMLGCLIGDGWFINNDKDCRVGFTFGKSDFRHFGKIKNIFNGIYGKDIKETIRENGVIRLSYHSRGFVKFLEKLGVKQLKADHKVVPESIFTAPEDVVSGFLQGLFSADGTVNIGKNKTRYIRLTSKSEKLLKDVQILLLNFGIKSKIYERHRDRRITFRYKTIRGELRLYESDGVLYELQISRDMIPIFLREIGFLYDLHSEKIRKLEDFEYYKTDFTDKIVAVEGYGWENVYDLTEPLTNSFVGNGFIVHNCGEQPLAAYTACNLGNLNLTSFVREDGTFDLLGIARATQTATRFLDDIIDYNMGFHALPKIREAVDSDRRVGLGTTGLGDALVLMRLKYDSEEALAAVEKIMQVICCEAYRTSIELAREKGSFPLFDRERIFESKFIQGLPEDIQEGIRKHGLRNSTLITMPPVGTGSIVAQTSSGIEPIFCTSYVRRVKQDDGSSFKEYKVYHPLIRRLFGGDEDLPQHVVTAHQIDPFFRVKMQGVIQRYVDSSVSSTINLPENTSVKTIADIYIQAYKQGLKGVTVYREGSRQGILETAAHADAKKGEGNLESRVKGDGYLHPARRPAVLHGITERVRTGEGNVFVTLNYDSNGELFEVFSTIGKAGGNAAAQSEAISRLISLALRSHIDPADVVPQLKGIGGPSPVWENGEQILSTPDAIGKVIEGDLIRRGKMPSKQVETEEPEQYAIVGSGKGVSMNGTCPDCGAATRSEGDCVTCHHCGWSKC